MIEKILDLSVRNRWFVVLLTVRRLRFGVWSLTKLPIDAVPDVTNNQVQINAIAPALSPVEIEKQVTFPLETALAGTPALEYTRSFSRNGFAQVTAVFNDKINIYFARQQVNERLQRDENAAAGRRAAGADLDRAWRDLHVDGRVSAAGQGCAGADGKPGWQSDGSYLTPEGERLRDDFERAVYLRTVQDWIIRPQMQDVPGVAGADAIGGFVKQYHVRQIRRNSVGAWHLVRRHRQGRRGQQRQPRRELCPA